MRVAGQLTFPGPSRSLAICALYVASSLSSFLILTSIVPIRLSVCSVSHCEGNQLTELIASDRFGFGFDLFVPNICVSACLAEHLAYPVHRAWLEMCWRTKRGSHHARGRHLRCTKGGGRDKPLGGECGVSARSTE